MIYWQDETYGEGVSKGCIMASRKETAHNELLNLDLLSSSFLEKRVLYET